MSQLNTFFKQNRIFIYWVLGVIALTILILVLTRGFPGHLRLSALIATGLGIGLLAIASFAKGILGHLLRDIGIAFIVAVIVTVIFEYNTRNIEERETMLTFIDRTMVEFVPPNVWQEVKQEILQRQRIRRNVNIDMKILRSAWLSTGKHVIAPPGQVILWMKYSYDLYGMKSGSAVPVQHQLGFEMWNKELDLPRFENVSVIFHQGRLVKMYVGDDLKRIYDNKGSIHLDGQDIIHLPDPRAKQPVTIITERYELVSFPGSYNLVMPELTAGSNEPQEPTIKITISEIPWDIDAKVETFYAAHSFIQPDKTRNTWVYDKTMLPGQGFSLLVVPKLSPADQASVKTQ